MVSLSLCMIVKNEENTLERCLNSVKSIVDEIIIVDTGSTDRTVEIARRFGSQPYHFQWIDDFSAARNFAFQHAQMDYILTMDADDILEETEIEKLLDLKRSIAPTIDAVTMKYIAGFDESGNVSISLSQIRIVKREKEFKWHGAVHEYLEVSGNILHSDIAVTHKREHQNNHRNLKIYEKRLYNGASFSPRDLFYYANELFDHEEFPRAIHYYQKFLQSENRWVEDEIQAYSKISDCFCQLGHMDQAIQYALKPFQLGPPRPESCCRLGFFFLQQDMLESALHWFLFAAQVPELDTGGIMNHACSTWIPHLQLCVCYSKLGDYSKAYSHIVIAHSICPNHELILKNKTLLESHLNINKTPQ